MHEILRRLARSRWEREPKYPPRPSGCWHVMQLGPLVATGATGPPMHQRYCRCADREDHWLDIMTSASWADHRSMVPSSHTPWQQCWHNRDGKRRSVLSHLLHETHVSRPLVLTVLIHTGPLVHSRDGHLATGERPTRGRFCMAQTFWARHLSLLFRTRRQSP